MLRSTRLLTAALLVSSLTVAPALAADGPAAGGTQRFGAAITQKKPVNIEKLAKAPEKFAGRTVRLEGTVKDVCQGKGCWVEVVTANGASFLARSLDESILLPKDCKGQKVVVQGVVKALPRAIAEAPKEDHACPRPNYVVATQGVELTPGR